MSEPAEHSVVALMRRLTEAGEGDEVTVAEIMKAVGQRSLAALLLMPALLIVTPVSAVPGLPTIAGLLIAFVAVQLAVGRETVWVPRFVHRRSLKRERLQGAQRLLSNPLEFMDHILRRRLPWLSSRPVATAFLSMCALGGASMPLLEFIPMSSSIVAAVIALLSLALVTRDGVVAILGLLVLAGGGGLLVWFLL
jgi:hypothetical protein